MMSALPEHIAAVSSAAMLDNPIWHALSTSQRSFAQGNALAKRYLPEIGPLAGMERQSSASYGALRQVVAPGDSAALFLTEAPKVPQNWELARTFAVHQMVCESFQDFEEANEESVAFKTLTVADVPQMLTLTEMTEPGPFRKRTIELGKYLGVFSPDRQLIALSGERLRMPGYTEVSAVCTHPDYRGKGYTRSLMSILIREIRKRGETPFLHVKGDNAGAIRLYESLGFRFRISFHLALVKNTFG